MTSKERLRNFIQKNLNGGCKMLSLGDDCVCPLCDFDRLVEEIDHLSKEAEKAKVKQVFFLEIGEFWDTPDVKKMFSTFETAKNEVPKNFVEEKIDGYLYYATTPKGEGIRRYAIITKYPIEDLIIA